MARYIDAEKLKASFSNAINDFLPKFEIALMIDDAPTADVEEVRHGEWQKEPTDFSLCGIVYYSCSLCGFEEQIRTNYCPNCGAKMDGKEKTDGNNDGLSKNS